MKKHFIAAVLCVALLSCKKDGTEAKDSFAILSLESIEEITSNIPAADYTGLQFVNANKGFAISEEFIVQTKDGGVNWESPRSWTGLTLSLLHFANTMDGFIVAKDEASFVLLITSDGGNTWEQKDIEIASSETVTGIYFIDADKGFITGDGIFIKTVDGGETWTDAVTSVQESFGDIVFKTATEGYATASDGRFYKTTDGGNTWHQEQSKRSENLTSIYIAESRVYAKANASLVDLRGGNVVMTVPDIASSFVFLTDEKAIGVGSHYETGFWPYGDVLVSNNGWRSYVTKKYMPEHAIAFRLAAKAGEHSTIILGVGHTQTTVVRVCY